MISHDLKYTIQCLIQSKQKPIRKFILSLHFNAKTSNFMAKMLPSGLFTSVLCSIQRHFMKKTSLKVLTPWGNFHIPEVRMVFSG